MINVKEAGFTLVELLMVIAIIGIIASIVLADLSTARDRAADTVVSQNLQSLRTQAGFFYDDNGNYIDFCLDSRAAVPLDESAGAVGNPHNCDSDTYEWAAEIQLNTGEYYCVDSSGSATTTNASKGADTTECA